MEFTYKWYGSFLHLLKENKYEDCNYIDWKGKKKAVILRHDIDVSPASALEFSKIENYYGMTSTYFVLLDTDFYNPASRRQRCILKEIYNAGHQIGLHFDETSYGMGEDFIAAIKREVKILSDILELPISSVSMHRPSSHTLEANYKIPGIVNSYGTVFFHEFKYLSDSRRYWREDVDSIIKQQQYPLLHILTHPFWYNETEKDITDSVKTFIYDKKWDNYHLWEENTRDFIEILKPEEMDSI